MFRLKRNSEIRGNHENQEQHTRVSDCGIDHVHQFIDWQDHLAEETDTGQGDHQYFVTRLTPYCPYRMFHPVKVKHVAIGIPVEWHSRKQWMLVYTLHPLDSSKLFWINQFDGEIETCCPIPELSVLS